MQAAPLYMVEFAKDSLDEALLKKGLGWHYLKYDKSPESSQMEVAASNAKLKPNPSPFWT